jgi:hypothetical protein
LSAPFALPKKHGLCQGRFAPFSRGNTRLGSKS